ncbi:acyl-CoA dehydrogenase family protein [Falsiroseomonas sp. HW251]|uniref:acyl-CoA dehydrogenase family protein n=1 Tax=Falsiroseomonas sp. HW251 TaxID=3390998 RepID=UPI003D321D0E
MSDDSAMLRDSVTKMLAAHYDFAARKRYLATPQGWSDEMWGRYAGLGLTALGLPEAQGGLGGVEELAIVFEAFGRALAMEPLLASTVLGATAVSRAGSDAQQARILPQVAEGSLRLALAHAEPGSRHGGAIATAASRDGEAWRLLGRKANVLHGDSAGLLVVSARLPDGATGLFLVEPDAAGLVRHGGRLQDGTRIADLIVDKAPAEKLDGNGAAALEASEQAGLAALLSSCVGAMDAALGLTVDYMKTRQQFGRAIGSYQALQHRAADMLVAVEEARSMAAMASEALAEPDPARRTADLSRAKVVVARCGRFVGQQAVQLHGGIGMTEEYAAGHYLRFLTVANLMFGDAEWHLARLAEQLEA